MVGDAKKCFFLRKDSEKTPKNSISLLHSISLTIKPAQQIKPLNFPSPCVFAHLRALRETQQNKSTLQPTQQIKPLNFPSPCTFAHLRALRETQQNKSTIKPLNQRSNLTH